MEPRTQQDETPTSARWEGRVYRIISTHFVHDNGQYGSGTAWLVLDGGPDGLFAVQARECFPVWGEPR